MERDGSCRAWSRGFQLDIRCGGPPVVHHMMLKGMGGSGAYIHDAANLIVLCDRHHRGVHSQVAAARDCGLILAR
jgi:acyl CoA:acetate/3-ketoacid CoA transferase beta subunit